MPEMTAAQKLQIETRIHLARIADLRTAIQQAQQRYESELDELLTEAGLLDEVRKLTAKRLALVESMETTAAEHEAEARRLTLEHGSTISHPDVMLQAVFNKARIKWDDKKLQGYAVSHPEVLRFREEGSPSISIRTMKG